MSDVIPFDGLDGDEEKPQSWMVSFADLMALLLTFMVVAFSMNAVDDGLWADMSEGLGLAFAGGGEVTSVRQDPKTPISVSTLDAEYMADLLVARVTSLTPSAVEVEGNQVRVALEGADLASVAQVLSRMEEPVTLEVSGALGSDAKPVQRQLAWERALREAVRLRNVMSAQGLEVSPALSVDLSLKGDEAMQSYLVLKSAETLK